MKRSTTGGSPPEEGPDELLRAVIETVADAEDVDPMELPPLYDAIDPDALKTLLCSASEDVTVEFTYVEYRVVLRYDDGCLTVETRRD